MSENIIKNTAIQQLFPADPQDKIKWELGLLTFFKQVKNLYGKPADDPKVKQMVDDFYQTAFEVFGIDSFRELSELISLDESSNQEEIALYIEEIERLVPTPLTKKEERWLQQVTEQYLDRGWEERR
ncbi:hypothetical protein [Gracilibacillus alcaliphilus]|uniref:hypothetical protein n=1 Tax=Gracilibacillus alcaliphilus TaxID=1401441 RepID=UPI00195DD513|nr:hypothetical protein [Gracilibacillus alcaliphilus]MBM7675317.1 hypothetical protein [Gracilibacillus alcaliphilus]